MSTVAKAGTLLSIESGEYSDYSVWGFFVVLKDLDVFAERDEWVRLHPEQAQRYYFEGNSFLAALLAKGYLLEIPYGVIHLSDYSSGEIEFTPLRTPSDVDED